MTGSYISQIAVQRGPLGQHQLCQAIPDMLGVLIVTMTVWAVNKKTAHKWAARVILLQASGPLKRIKVQSEDRIQFEGLIQLCVTLPTP
jgi:hypothetical protein